MLKGSKTTNKRLKNLNFNPHGGKKFSRQRQPTGEKKSAGWKRKKFGREVIRALLEGKFNLSDDLKKKLVESFGNIDDKTIGEIMTLRQIEKAIKSADTPALVNLMNQAYGQPKSEIDVTTDGKPMNLLPDNIKSMTFEQLKELLATADSKSGKD